MILRVDALAVVVVVLLLLASTHAQDVSVARDKVIAGRTFPVWWSAPLSSSRTSTDFIAFTASTSSCPYETYGGETAVIGNAATSGYVELVLGPGRPPAYYDGRVVMVVVWPTQQSFTLTCSGRYLQYVKDRYVQLTTDTVLGGGPGYAARFMSTFALSALEQDAMNRIGSAFPETSSLAVWAVGLCDSPTFNWASSLTAELWFKMPARAQWPAAKQLLDVPLITLSLDDATVFEIAISGLDGSFVFTTQSLTGACAISRTLPGQDYSEPGNSWRHVAAVYSSSDDRKLLYLDGKLIQTWNCSSSQPFDPDTKRIQLGRDYFDGWIDEVRIWTSARTQSQILSTMNRTLYADEAVEVQAYYNFDSPAAESLDVSYDDSGKNKHLTLGFEPFTSGYNTPRINRKPQILGSDNSFLFGGNLILEAPAWSDYTTSKVTIPVKGVSGNFMASTSYTLMYFPPEVSLTTASGQVLTSYPLTVSEDIIAYVSFGFFGTSTLWTRANDSSPTFDIKILVQQNNVPLAGGPGGMLYCDGVNDFAYAKDLSLNQVNLSTSERELTVEFWAYFMENSKTGIFASLGDEEVTGNWCGSSSFCSGRMIIGTEEISIGWNNDGNGRQTLDYQLERYWGRWNHFAITSDGTAMKIYVNGEQRYSNGAGSWRNDILGMYLCHWPYYGSSSHWFRGFMDEVRVWNNAKSLAEIKAGMRKKPISSSSLIAYWSFDEQFSEVETLPLDVVFDQSGNNYDLVLGGCTPDDPMYCNGQSPCSKDQNPFRPCFGTGSLNSSRPAILQSFAPVATVVPVVVTEMEQEILIDLMGFDVDSVNSLSTLQFQITKLPSRGILKDLSSSVQISNVPFSVIGSQVVFTPNPQEGGIAYDNFEYSVFDGNYVSTPIGVSFAVKCSSGRKLNEETKSCELCEPGKFQDSSSFSASCQPVPPNTFTNSFGSSSFLLCDIGSEVKNDGEACELCSPGRFGSINLVTGFFYCEDCNSSFFQDQSGQLDCKPCPANKVPNAEHSRCTSPSRGRLSEAASIAFIVVACVLGLVCVCVGAFVYRNRMAKLIVAVSVPLTLMSVCGCLVLLVASILYVVDGQSPSFCQSRYWLLNIGATLAYGPLFLKLYRLLRIFGQKSLQVIALGNKVLLGLICLFLAFDVFMLSLWSGIYPSQIDYPGECQEPGLFLIGSILIIEKALFLFWGVYIAHKLKHVPITYNDAYHLGLICSSILVWFAFVVISNSIQLFSDGVSRITSSMLCFVLAGNMIFLVFIPRIRKYIQNPEVSNDWRKKFMESSETNVGGEKQEGRRSPFSPRKTPSGLSSRTLAKTESSKEEKESSEANSVSNSSSYEKIQKELQRLLKELDKVEGRYRHRQKGLEEHEASLQKMRDKMFLMGMELHYRKTHSQVAEREKVLGQKSLDLVVKKE